MAGEITTETDTNRIIIAGKQRANACTDFIPDDLHRNWTSIELAKPVWEEDEPQQRHGLSGHTGTAEVLDIDTLHNMEDTRTMVDTYGYWDQSLDIMPAMSR